MPPVLPWLQQSIYETDLRQRLRQNQVENTPGAMPAPSQAPTTLRAPSFAGYNLAPASSPAGGGKGGALNGYNDVLTKLAGYPASAPNFLAGGPANGAARTMEMLGLKSSPAGYKATTEQVARGDFSGVDQFQGRRIGGGSITENPLPALPGANAVSPGPLLSMPVVGQRGVGGTSSAMFGAPRPASNGSAQNLLQGAGRFLTAVGMAFSPPGQSLQILQRQRLLEDMQRERDYAKRWESNLEAYKTRAGVPSQLIEAARIAGPEKGSALLNQFVAASAGVPDLVNITDTEAGRTFMTTKQRATAFMESDPQRYALAGVSSNAGRGNYINMVAVDDSGQAAGAPFQVLEGSPQHQQAVAQGMVESGPLSLNSRDPVRDRRVVEYQQLYKVDRATATKLADGLIKGYTDPLTGQTQFVDMVDLSRGRAQAAPVPTNTPPAPMLPPPGGQPLTVSAPAGAPPPVPGRAVMPGEAAPSAPAAMDPMTTPLLGLTYAFGGKQPVQESLGRATMGGYDPGAGVNVPRNRFRILKQDIFDMYGGNRMSDQDRERIERAFPSEGIFESEAAAFDSLSTWANEAQNTIATQRAIADDTSRSPAIRKEAEAKVIAAEKALRTIGDPKQFKRPGSAKLPQPGDIEDGYRFKGGNPADRANWEKVR